MKYWLVKSEEDVYGIDDLERDGSTFWDGVRNYEARNNLRAMRPGELVLYYHSNASPPGVVGVARVMSEPYPDPTQFDRESRYFDEKSDENDPRWWLVDLEFVERFPRRVALEHVKADEALSEMQLVKRMRLSVQKVEEREFDRVRAMGGGG